MNHLYDRSHYCPIWFSSQSELGQIGDNNFVSYLAQIASIRLVTQLSYLIFIIISNQSNWSQKFRIIFSIDCTCAIDHVVILSTFHHRPHLIRQVLIVQFWFQCRPNLYNQSHHYPVLFLSQIVPDLISHDSPISFLTNNALIPSITQLSYLIFIIDCTQ